MNSIILSLIVFACVLCGIILGVLLRRVLPERHLGGETKDVVRLGTGLIGTLAALVLGLLIASAKSSYDTSSTQVKQITANIALMDLLLAEYGPEARDLRELLRTGVDRLVDQIWHPRSSSDTAPFVPTREGEAFYRKVQELSPKNDMQRSLQARAVQITNDLTQARLLLFTQKSDALPTPFLVVLAFWLATIFMSFSLFAEPNVMVLGTLVLFALSAGGAIYLNLELNQPFAGLLQISSAPLAHALPPLGRP